MGGYRSRAAGQVGDEATEQPPLALEKAERSQLTIAPDGGRNVHVRDGAMQESGVVLQSPCDRGAVLPETVRRGVVEQLPHCPTVALSLHIRAGGNDVQHLLDFGAMSA